MPSARKIITQQPPNKTESKYDGLTVPNTATRARLNKGLLHITDFHHIPGAVAAWIPKGVRQQQKRLKSQVWRACWKGAFLSRWLRCCPIRPLAREAPPPVSLRLRSNLISQMSFWRATLPASNASSEAAEEQDTITLGIGGFRANVSSIGTSSYFKLRQQRSGHELEDHWLHRLQNPGDLLWMKCSYEFERN